MFRSLASLCSRGRKELVSASELIILSYVAIEIKSFADSWRVNGYVFYEKKIHILVRI